jgi:hypothetical protein
MCYGFSDEKIIRICAARDGFLGFGWHSCPSEGIFRTWNVPHQKAQEASQEAQEKEVVRLFVFLCDPAFVPWARRCYF